MAAPFFPRETKWVILVHQKNTHSLLIMKITKLFQCFFAASVASLFLAAPCVSAQTPPVLGIQLYAGVSITGTNAGLYAIQATGNVADSNSWACAGLVTLPQTNYFWTDTSKSASSGQRFYRAVLTATNLTYILPGTFTMGSPTNEALRNSDEVQHVVTISHGFFMGKFPVTQGEYLAVVGSNPSFHTGNLNYPVEKVSWYDATNYCGLRTAQERAAGLIPANWAYRLPTEAEWEYACRAGTTTAFYLGSALHSQQANFAGTNEYDAVVGNIYNASGVYLQATTVVGGYAPNGWGLYDLAGNVDEWCQDWYGDYPAGSVTDPQGPASGTFRIHRGGYWFAGGANCRSAIRAHIMPANDRNASGFRAVLAQQ
jgi:sulfatase modifying factor 1